MATQSAHRAPRATRTSDAGRDLGGVQPRLGAWHTCTPPADASMRGDEAARGRQSAGASLVAWCLPLLAGALQLSFSPLVIMSCTPLT